MFCSYIMGFMEIVQDNKSLLKACKLIKKQKIIYIDTEFLRDKTYWPLLCLIQVKTARKTFGIDMIALRQTDFTEFKEILINKKILKIIHAGRQDLEVIFLKLAIIINPIFDTQIAYNFLMNEGNIGYTTLVKKLLNKSLNKDFQVSDWSQRPLSKKQINYACNDVKYLPSIYKILSKEIKNKKRVREINKEFEKFEFVKNIYDINYAWKKIKFKKKSNINLTLLKKFSKWRELEAQQLNLPRNWVITDKIIIKAAKKEIKKGEKSKKNKNKRLNSYLNKFLDYLESEKFI